MLQHATANLVTQQHQNKKKNCHYTIFGVKKPCQTMALSPKKAVTRLWLLNRCNFQPPRATNTMMVMQNYVMNLPSIKEMMIKKSQWIITFATKPAAPSQGHFSTCWKWIHDVNVIRRLINVFRSRLNVRFSSENWYHIPNRNHSRSVLLLSMTSMHIRG